MVSLSFSIQTTFASRQTALKVVQAALGVAVSAQLRIFRGVCICTTGLLPPLRPCVQTVGAISPSLAKRIAMWSHLTPAAKCWSFFWYMMVLRGITSGVFCRVVREVCATAR